MHNMTMAELRHRVAELELKAERINLEIPGVQQRRAWAQRKRYLQQAEDFQLLLEYAEAKHRGDAYARQRKN